VLLEIAVKEFQTVRRLFPGRKQYVPVFAILDGHFPGRVFVDDKERPAVALVWAVSRWAYVGGDPTNAGFLAGLPTLIRETLIPDSAVMGMDWFEMYAPNDTVWIDAVTGALDEFRSEMHYEDVSVLNRERWGNREPERPLGDGARIEKIDVPIVPARAQGATFIPEEFKSKTTFGFQAVMGDRVISRCRSNGLAAGDDFMVDVETFSEDDRCKGFATAVSAALIEYSLENGYAPLWETTHWNAASQKVAAKLCFEKTETYPVFAALFGPKASG
jgi:hypothetical protein